MSGLDGASFGRGSDARPTPGEAEREQRNGPNRSESPEKSAKPGTRAGDPRRSRTIRFSDSEWQLIEDAALRQGIPASQLVRTVILAAVEERLDRPAEPAIAPGHLALIKATYRAVYVLATINREEMLDAERGKELDEIVEAARNTMRETMDEAAG